MKVIKQIGEGGFGIVSHVQDENGDDWAKKELSLEKIHPDFIEQAVRRFKREVGYQSDINHINVVKIEIINLEEDPPWFTMPLASHSLQQSLSEDRTLGGDYTLPLFDILNGLETIHNKGYYHRDLKPANILAFIDEESTSYAISDFGLISAKDKETTQITSTGMQAGTEAYSAPECYTNFKDSNHLADIYSFGAILHDIFSEESSRIPYSNLTVPGKVGPVVERCTQREPAARFQDIGELREAFEVAIKGLPVNVQLTAVQQIIQRRENDQDAAPSEWQNALKYLSNTVDEDAEETLLNNLSLSEIDTISNYQGLFSRLAIKFASHIQNRGFSFELCDGLADRAMRFYQLGTDSIKAKMTIATLELGASHNRWYVENIFAKMAEPTISLTTAQRILNEANIQEYAFYDTAVKALKTIHKSESAIHPLLLGAS